MLAMKYEPKINSSRKSIQYKVGDRVMTNNCRLGTVVRIAQDEFGEYIVVRLDILPGEFAYDMTDLEKIQ